MRRKGVNLTKKGVNLKFPYIEGFWFLVEDFLKIIFLHHEIVEVFFHGGTITRNWSHSYIYIYIEQERTGGSW